MKTNLVADARRGASDGDASHLGRLSDAALVAHLCELFEQIDVNGNGSLDWDEFTSHIVEMVMATHDHKPDAIQHYQPAFVKEISKRRTSYVKELYYFPDNDSVVAFDVDAPSFRVFGAEKLDDRLKITRDEGHLVCIDHMPATQQYVASTTDLMLSVYCAPAARAVVRREASDEPRPRRRRAFLRPDDPPTAAAARPG